MRELFNSSNFNYLMTLCIAFTFGTVCGASFHQRAYADNPVQPYQITRHDLFEAAALAGMCANRTESPIGSVHGMWGEYPPSDFIDASKVFADIACRQEHK